MNPSPRKFAASRHVTSTNSVVLMIQEGGQTIVILHNRSVKLVERLNVANVGTLALRIVAQTASSVSSSRPAEMSPDRTSSVGVHAGPACEEKRALGNNVRLWCHFSKSTSSRCYRLPSPAAIPYRCRCCHGSAGASSRGVISARCWTPRRFLVMS